MANYSQRYSSAQSNTAGAFKFDTITSVDWPVAKLIWGAEGVATYASAADPLPIVSAATNTILGEVQASPTANTVLDRLKTIGTALAGTLTVGSHAVTNAGTFAVQVSSALPAGTNAIGKLAANDGVDIGDVTINNASLAVTGTFWQATQPISATFAGTNGGSQPTNAVQLGYYIDGDAFSLVADTNPYPVRDTGLNDSNYVRVIGGYDGSQVRKVAVNSSGYVYTNALMQVGGTVASGNNGTVNNSTQRVTIASDSTGTLAGVTTVTTLTGGGVAHDSADSGNPVKVGAKAASSLASATLVSAADRTNLVSDLDGALIVRNGAPLGDNKSTSQSVTDTTSTAATNFGAVASTKNVITEITVYNSSATPTFVKIQDGSGGTTFWTVPAPAGGGSVIQFHRGLKQPTANTALYFAANDSATTVYVSINGYQSKV